MNRKKFIEKLKNKFPSLEFKKIENGELINNVEIRIPNLYHVIINGKQLKISYHDGLEENMDILAEQKFFDMYVDTINSELEKN